MLGTVIKRRTNITMRDVDKENDTLTEKARTQLSERRIKGTDSTA
jgi:hypothetical protein